MFLANPMGEPLYTVYMPIIARISAFSTFVLARPNWPPNCFSESRLSRAPKKCFRPWPVALSTLRICLILEIAMKTNPTHAFP